MTTIDLQRPSENKVIEDIRLFTSTVPNVDGAPLPNYISNPLALRFANRVARKLWENNFILGDYTHLYIDYNFSVGKSENGFSLRSTDKYHPWFRYYEYGVSDTDLNSANLRFFADSIKEILISEYSNNDIDIDNIIEYVYLSGENTEIKYKQISNEEYTVIITLRILDNGKLLPAVKILKGGLLITSKNLSESTDTGALGKITVSKHKVTIKPKTAIIYKNLPSTIIEF